jgi:hypothetical protein
MKKTHVICPRCGTDWESTESRKPCPQCNFQADANDARDIKNKASGCGGWAGLVAVGVIASIVLVALMSPSDTPPAPVEQSQPVNVRQNEPTQQSVPIIAEIQPETGSEDSVAQTETGFRFIPGLSAADVHGNFTSRGFGLSSDFRDSANKIWRCTTGTPIQNEMMIEIFGPSEAQITLVRATYINVSGDDRSAVTTTGSKPFLSELGNLIYDGSDTNRAQRWISSNVGNTKTTTIGHVSFELIANPKAQRVRMLLIRPRSVVTDVADGNNAEQDPVFREKKATSKVEMAKLIFNEKDNSVARKRLQQVIDDYPETEAAKQALKLLERL